MVFDTASSPDSLIERNLLVANREGFNFREQTRTTPRIGSKQEVAVWNHGELIRHNIIAFNRDAQVWGWFDMKDNRHWPAAGKRDDQSAKNPETGALGPPEQSPLSLEQLRLHLDQNVYFATPGQGWFQWGVTWARHQSYANLSDFQSELNIDTGGVVLDPGFANAAARDFRLPRQIMDKVAHAYPRGPFRELFWMYGLEGCPKT